MLIKNIFNNLTMRSNFILLFIIPFLSGCSVFGINTVEEARYDVLKVHDDFELRLYDPIVIAETSVDGHFSEAGKQGFRQLFRYISGDNKLSREIAMTAPVIVDKPESGNSKEIAMTTPVLEERAGQGWRYMFVLPSQYNIDNTPTPLNENVKISAEPQKRVAVLRFSGLLDEKVINEKTDQLEKWIKASGLIPASKSRWAGYNPPWTIPFLRRNEIMIEVM